MGAREPEEPPAGTPRPVQPLALLLDVVFLLALAALAYVLLGGAIRWNSSLVRVKLTEVDRPLQVLVAVLAVKALTGLDRGLFARLAARRPPLIGPVASCLHALDRALHARLVANWRELVLSAVVGVLSLGLLEAYMRWLPQTLPRALGNHVATAYHDGPSGIYRYVPELRMELMRPNHERVMYFNGYWWRHRTDSLGFRNPVDRSPATVVLLGDSMIYGHGVGEPSTVRHHLETLLGQPVVNLGMQGSSIHHEYQVLKAFGVAFRPQYVFAFFLGNDIDDLGLLSVNELTTFLGTPVADHTTPYVNPAPPRSPWPDLGAYLGELYVVRAYDFLHQYLRALRRRTGEASAQPATALYEDNPRLTLQLRFHLHALRKMQNLAERHRFALVHVFIYTGLLPDELPLEQALAAFCAENGIAFLSLRPALERAIRNGEGVFLPEDGHLSDAGARLVAGVLARYVAEHPAGSPDARPPGP